MKKLWNHICEVLLEDTVFDFQKKKSLYSEYYSTLRSVRILN